MTDQLNTNPLTDDVISPTKTKSCWWGHKWSAWEDTDDRGTLSQDGIKTGRFVYQERRCTRCNKVELNKITSTSNGT